MKKLLFIAVVGVASLASCKKDHACTCVTTTTTTTTTGSSTTTSTDVTSDVITYNETSKGAARANCLDNSTTNTGTTTFFGVTTTTKTDEVSDCTLN